MLSYQHAYHAGNAADFHKHALLATAMAYLTRKPKPLTYIETHAGRGLYDLESPEAAKTGEARAGVLRAEAKHWLPPKHPLQAAIAETRGLFGPSAYPGSPLIAGHFLRADDRAWLAELHPAEHAALAGVARFANIRQEDGLDMAQAICPPKPRRGVMLIDPSYEVKADYVDLPRQIAQLHRKWNVGMIALWYPILRDRRHLPLTENLRAAHPDALLSEISFPTARPGHSMTGSGMFVINPPWSLAEEAARIEEIFKAQA